MSDTSDRLVPRRPVPKLRVPTLSGEIWDLGEQSPKNFTMIVFYRGFHCPVCSKYTRELDTLHAKFVESGVSCLLVSSDSRERAEMARERWSLGNIAIGYDLSIDSARSWGLYVSAGKGKSSSGVEEPEIFSEPGVFMVRPDRTLYWATYSTMPFARPHFEEILQAIGFVLRVDYPARGELG